MKERSSPEKQVFPTHYFLTMPHLVIEGSLGGGELLPSLTPCQPGSKHTRGEADGEKWDEAGNGCGWGEGSRYYPQQHSKVRTCAKIAGEESGGGGRKISIDSQKIKI